MANHTAHQNWKALLDRMKLSDLNLTTHAKLLEAYSLPDRHYHSLAHIDDCLEQLALCGLPNNRADPIALALWFHDGVYNWRSKTNEADSATWAIDFLKGCDASEELMTKVHDLIMATRHRVLDPVVGDQLHIADIDLSILGREPAAYDVYESAIRQEYRWVPDVTYRRERRSILRSFLDKERIFATDRFYNLYEMPSRENLSRAIELL